MTQERPHYDSRKATSAIKSWLNPLWTSDTIWCLRCGFTLVKVMAYYLIGAQLARLANCSQCCLIFDWNSRNQLKWKLSKNTTIFIQKKAFQYAVCKMGAIWFQLQCLDKKFLVLGKWGIDFTNYKHQYQSTHNIDRLMQERHNSSALAMELCLSCTNPSICHCTIACKS